MNLKAAKRTAAKHGLALHYMGKDGAYMYALMPWADGLYHPTPRDFYKVEIEQHPDFESVCAEYRAECSAPGEDYNGPRCGTGYRRHR